MTLVQSWIDSLQLLKPKNFQLFAMVTLKSIIESYKILLRYVWYLLLAAIASIFIPYFIPSLTPTTLVAKVTDFDLLWFSYLLYTIWFLAVCFSTRPSIEKKDGAYFHHIFRHTWMCFVVLAALFWPSARSAWTIFTVLFVADSRGGIKQFFYSICNALKMVIYNYPLLCVFGLIFYLPSWLLRIAMLHYAYEFSLPIDVYLLPLCTNVIAMLLAPIIICTYTNIYIKKLHDQFDLYFKQ